MMRSHNPPGSAATASAFVSLVLAFVLVLGGCGTDERAGPVTESIEHLRFTIQTAKASRMDRHAAAEIATAEEKLMAARHAAQEKKYDHAARFIAETAVNIELAMAKASAARLKSAVGQLEGTQSGGAAKDGS